MENAAGTSWKMAVWKISKRQTKKMQHFPLAFPALQLALLAGKSPRILRKAQTRSFVGPNCAAFHSYSILQTLLTFTWRGMGKKGRMLPFYLCISLLMSCGRVAEKSTRRSLRHDSLKGFHVNVKGDSPVTS